MPPNLIGVEINDGNFPDATFRNYVKNKFDGDGNGTLSAEEINVVVEMDVNSKGIKDLKGVEHFTAMHTLSCSDNQLTSLDVSKNSHLVKLVCNGNQLASLDVSKNTALKELKCYKNQLTSLDVSKNTALENLSCKDNNLNTIYVGPNNSNLTDDKIDCDQGVFIDRRAIVPTMYTVSFKVNGGTGNMRSVSVFEGSSYTLPISTFTAPKGKQFKNWEVNGLEKKVGESISINADTVVKAIWEEIPAKQKQVEKGIRIHKAYITGYPDGSIKANGNMTRAEALAVLVRLEELKLGDTAETVYKDTKGSKWYNAYINSAYEKAWLEEKQGENFRPK